VTFYLWLVKCDCDSQVDCITLCLVERQQLTSSSSTKTHEKVVYQSQVFACSELTSSFDCDLTRLCNSDAYQRGVVRRRR
jgi:hypothetical protein